MPADAHNHVENPSVGYERSDASMRGVLAFIIILAIVGILVHIVLWGMYRYFAAGERAKDPVPNPLLYGARPQPPLPRLQPSPVADMNRMRVSEQQRLETYGWVDKQSGIAHIPIQRAMDLALERGFPTRPAAAQPAPGKKKQE